MTDKLETVERAIAGLIAGNNMPDMSGDNRNRLSPMQRLLCTRVAKAAIAALTPPAGDEVERARRAATEWRIPSNADGTGELVPPKDDCIWGFEQGYLAALSRPNVDEMRLPCDVRLPPATLIGAGCSLSTLMLALDARREAGVVHFKDADTPVPEYWQTMNKALARQCLPSVEVDARESARRDGR